MSDLATADRSRRPPPTRRLTIAGLTLLRARQELLAAADLGPSGRAIAAHLGVAAHVGVAAHLGVVIAEIDRALALMVDRPIERPLPYQ